MAASIVSKQGLGVKIYVIARPVATRDIKAAGDSSKRSFGQAGLGPLPTARPRRSISQPQLGQLQPPQIVCFAEVGLRSIGMAVLQRGQLRRFLAAAIRTATTTTLTTTAASMVIPFHRAFRLSPATRFRFEPDHGRCLANPRPAL
jgi:hypothetical protein